MNRKRAHYSKSKKEQRKRAIILQNEKIVRTVIHTGQRPTEAQIREIGIATSMPVVPDEDAPELTLEQYAEMAAIARNRRSQRV